jgi:hypothetical protein
MLATRSDSFITCRNVIHYYDVENPTMIKRYSQEIRRHLVLGMILETNLRIRAIQIITHWVNVIDL